MEKTKEQIRQAAKLDGIRNAYQGIPDTDRQAAIAFYVNYALRHEYFTSGDVLAAWRKTDDPIAQQDWRNRWGAMGRSMSSSKFEVVKFHSMVKPTNVQSHGNEEIRYQSQIYDPKLVQVEAARSTQLNLL